MRRRLVLLSLSTTVLVVIALIVPLGLLVREQASDRAKVSAEADAQQVAGVVALAIAVDDEPAAIAESVGRLPAGTIVVLESGDVVGVPSDGQGELAAKAISSEATTAGPVGDGWEIAIPVIGASTVVAIDSFVSADQLTEGVLGAWMLLGLVGVILIGVAVVVADRMGRGLVRPVEDLAKSAHQLAEGQLNTRVEPSEPEELREMGEAFNYLAGRLRDLLHEERESVADLSHRLRTPLTSLRLQTEALEDDEERAAVLSQIDRLERSMDDVIELTRSRSAESPAASILDDVVEKRVTYWQVLSSEQSRELVVDLGAGEELVDVSAGDVAAIVDILIENVFSYTPVGSPINVTTGIDNGHVWIEVADRGPGFGVDAAMRGVSGGGSTGLGLDIARRTAGSLTVDNRPGGGAVVRVVFRRS